MRNDVYRLHCVKQQFYWSQTHPIHKITIVKWESANFELSPSGTNTWRRIVMWETMDNSIAFHSSSMRATNPPGFVEILLLTANCKTGWIANLLSLSCCSLLTLKKKNIHQSLTPTLLRRYLWSPTNFPIITTLIWNPYPTQETFYCSNC